MTIKKERNNKTHEFINELLISTIRLYKQSVSKLIQNVQIISTGVSKTCNHIQNQHPTLNNERQSKTLSQKKKKKKKKKYKK